MKFNFRKQTKIDTMNTSKENQEKKNKKLSKNRKEYVGI